jgi:hypothetical protein
MWFGMKGSEVQILSPDRIWLLDKTAETSLYLCLYAPGLCAGCSCFWATTHQPTAERSWARRARPRIAVIGKRAAQLYLGLGLGLGGPWVAQGWPKRGPRATQAWRKGRMEEMLCLQQKAEKGRVGRKRSGDRA